MTDGFVARKTHTVSKRGAVLDSIADIVFLCAALYKLLFAIIDKTAIYIFIFAAVIALVRVAGYIIGAVKFRRFVSLHTYLNKVTGAALFLSVYFLGLPIVNPSLPIVNPSLPTVNPSLPNVNPVFTVVCFVAILSSFEELLIDIKSKTYNPEIKTVLGLNNKKLKMGGRT